MNYQFPAHITIDEVRAAIANRDEFVEKRTDEYIVFNYNVSFADTFPPVVDRETAILRELRGLIFYPDGRIASRRFHKFFNINEREETREDNIDWLRPFHVMDKLDGSMVTPFIDSKGNVRWFSKMGETFVSVQVEKWLEQDIDRLRNYERLALDMHKSSITPIFEWCSNANRIVVDYPVSTLTLISLRDNITGCYPRVLFDKEFMSDYGIPVVGMNQTHADKMESLDVYQANETGIEGWVLRFFDGHMAKLKTEWYLRLHKAKSYMTFEKDVVNLILNNELDDLLTTVTDEQRKYLEEYSRNLHTVLKNTADYILEEYRKLVVVYGANAKAFAIHFKDNYNALTRTAIFELYKKNISIDDHNFVLEYLVEMMKKNLSSGTKLEAFKKMLVNGDKLKYNLGDMYLED